MIEQQPKNYWVFKRKMGQGQNFGPCLIFLIIVVYFKYHSKKRRKEFWAFYYYDFHKMTPPSTVFHAAAENDKHNGDHKKYWTERKKKTNEKPYTEKEKRPQYDTPVAIFHFCSHLCRFCMISYVKNPFSVTLRGNFLTSHSITFK